MPKRIIHTEAARQHLAHVTEGLAERRAIRDYLAEQLDDAERAVTRWEHDADNYAAALVIGILTPFAGVKPLDTAKVT